MTPVFVHLHRTAAPPGGPGNGAIDVAGDQSPWVDLRGSAPETPAFAGLTWNGSPEPVGDIGWVAERSVDIADPRPPTSGGRTPGLKQVSLVRRRPDITAAAFRERYRAHVPLVLAHHGVVAYAQTCDLQPVYGVESDADRVDGISELWFATRDDWRDRFYLQADSPALVREDTSAFIDFATTRSILSDETRYP